MIAPAGTRSTRVSIGIHVRPLPGETESGDACAAIPWSRGAIAAIADGLGHGPHAAVAAHGFLAATREGAELALDELFARAHRALLRTRGAVAAVARFDESRASVEIAGMGNIAIHLLRAGESHAQHLVVAPGVLGSACRAVRPQSIAFGAGDVLVLHSDGVRARFDAPFLRSLAPQSAADSIVRSNGKDNDDASCIVARAGHDVPNAATRATPVDAKSASADRVLPIRIHGDAECAANEARDFARGAGFGARAQWEISIATSELATNMLKFASGGEIRLRHDRGPRGGVAVEAIDGGAGIADVRAAVTDGFSEGAALGPDRARRDGQGLGVGLGTVHRMMDDVEIASQPGRGTRVIAWKRRA